MRAELERILDYFSRREEVMAVYIFGSFDTPLERPDSDIDIGVLVTAVDTGRDWEQLKSGYYAASPGFSMRPVDIVVLNTAATFLKYHVLKTGRILLDSDPLARKRFTAQVLVELFDYQPIEDIYFNGVKRRLREAISG